MSSKIEDTDDQQEKTQAAVSMSDEGLKRLREALKTISFYHPGLSFKADRKDDCVWIRAMVSEHGLQSTKHSTKAKLDLLADAATMPADEFGARLELYLKKKGFEL